MPADKPDLSRAKLVTLRECPPGLFIFNDCLGCKSEYKTESLSRPGVWQSDAYVVESGEYFWGGTSNAQERELLLVWPVELDVMFANRLRSVNAALEALRGAEVSMRRHVITHQDQADLDAVRAAIEKLAEELAK